MPPPPAGGPRGRDELRRRHARARAFLHALLAAAALVGFAAAAFLALLALRALSAHGLRLP